MRVRDQQHACICANLLKGTGIFSGRMWTWRRTWPHWHCRQDLHQSRTLLAKPLQTNLVELRRLDAQTSGCDIPCKAEKMLNLWEDGTKERRTFVFASQSSKTILYWNSYEAEGGGNLEAEYIRAGQLFFS